MLVPAFLPAFLKTTIRTMMFRTFHQSLGEFTGIQMLEVAFNEFETRLKHVLRDRFGVVQGKRVTVPEFRIIPFRGDTCPSR